MKTLARVMIRLGRGEEGVAFVATLALFMFMYVVCMGVYAVGTQVKERIQLQNACDAAAYSAGVVQADTLSRIATINRAMAWTYVQMTRRQMDCIVARWLQRSLDIYDDDLEIARRWTQTMSICLPYCDKHHKTSNEPKPETFWCGVNENNIGSIWVNGISQDFFNMAPPVGTFLNELRSNIYSVPGVGDAAQHIGLGRAVDVDDIRKRLRNFKLYAPVMTYLVGTSAWKTHKSGDALGALATFDGNDFLKTQIALDKLAIKLMNLAEMKLVYDLDGRIDKAVEEVLRANIVDENFGRMRYMVKHKAKPFTWFKYLNNTKEDEQYFMSFAGYDDEPYRVFRGDPKDAMSLVFSGFDNSLDYKFIDFLDNNKFLKVATGTDRWFVRGDGTRRAKDSDSGIQRCYKHWNEDFVGKLLGLDGKTKHTKYVLLKVGGSAFYLPPTCLNFNGDDNEASSISSFKLSDGLPSVGLYSEWQYYSMSWFCYVVPFIIPYVVHESVCPMIPLISPYKDKHLDWDYKIDGKNQNCIYLPGDVISCSYKTYRKKKWRIKKRWRSSASGKTTNFGMPGFRGYTRVYADDPSIWCDEYIGEKCLPLLLNQTYFGEDGKITVGLARKNDNPWSEILWGLMSTVDKGPFAAFDPLTKWTWAFSTTTAGYAQDANSKAYIVDWRGDHEDIEQPEDSNWNNPAWNLCVANWDSVFVPVAESASWGYDGWWKTLGGNTLNKLITSGEWKELSDWDGVTSGNEDADWDKVTKSDISAGLASAFGDTSDKSGQKVGWASINDLLRH